MKKTDIGFDSLFEVSNKFIFEKIFLVLMEFKHFSLVFPAQLEKFC